MKSFYSSLIVVSAITIVVSIVIAAFVGEDGMNNVVSHVSSMLFDPPHRYQAATVSREFLLTSIVEQGYDAHRVVLLVGADEAVLDRLLMLLSPTDMVDVLGIDAYDERSFWHKYQHFSQVNLHHQKVMLWRPYYRYDYVIYAKNFSKLSATEIKTALDKAVSLVHEAGIVSYWYRASDTRQALLPELEGNLLQHQQIADDSDMITIEAISGRRFERSE